LADQERLIAELQLRIAELETALQAATVATTTTTVVAPATSTPTTSAGTSTTTIAPVEFEPESPAILLPPGSPYLTDHESTEVLMLAPASATVTINGMDMTARQPWVGGNMSFSAEVPLIEGENNLTITVASAGIEQTLDLRVVRDSGLIRGYGRILDTRASDASRAWEAGVDFGEIDLEPDYGRADFEAGDVVVEFLPMAADAVAMINWPYNEMLPPQVRGRDEIWDMLNLNLEPDHPYQPVARTWVWSILIDGEQIVQLETVALGD
jgi:hypothetical protein